jgi:hypothetical protein
VLLQTLLAAATVTPLPQHVASPQPGQVSFGLGIEGTRPAGDFRLPLADWVRLDLQLELHPEAPLMAGEVIFAAGAPRGPLTAHVFLGAALRPMFSAQVISGAQFIGGFGLVGVWQQWMASAEGGGAIGLSYEPVQTESLDADTIDQQGGVFALQRLTFGYDFAQRIQIMGRLTFALPLDALTLGEERDTAFPESEVRFGLRLFVRF